MGTTVTGLDIGHRTARACVLERSGKRIRLRGCAQVERFAHSGEPKPLPAVLAELDAKLPFGSRVVCASGDIGAMVRFVSTLPLPPDRLARLLRLELSQHVDASGDLAADTVVIPIGGDEIVHCCVLAQPAQVYSALVDLREAGVSAPQIHFAPAAAFNATLPLPPVRDEELALLIDIGPTTTGITLFGDERMLACRQIPIGSEQFSEPPSDDAAKPERPSPSSPTGPATPEAPPAAVDAEMDRTTTDRVSAVKPPHETEAAAGDVLGDDELLVLHDDALGGSAADPASVPRAGAVALDASRMRAAENLYGQLASSIAWFKAQLKLKTIDLKAVHLAGAGSALIGLDTYLSRRFGVPATLFDPFAGLDEASVAGARPERSCEYVSAAGLALSDPLFGLKHAVRLDLRPEAVVRRDLWRSTLIWPFAAAACIAIAAVFACATFFQQHSADRESLENYSRYKSEYEGYKTKLAALEREKDELSLDLRGIASRIYAGRDLLYTIRALKERTEKSKELWVTLLETVSVGQDADTLGEEERKGNEVAAKREAADIAIDRGAVDISGKVKFDSNPSEEKKNQLVSDWRKWIKEWTPDGTTAIFDEVHEHKSKSTVVAQEFRFSERFHFKPTDLSQVTADRVITEVKAAPSDGQKK
ncbi:MAG: hypothetical protein H0W83_03355 [Planctomycetes bacterium]|nr:hypothetical protein [Planctomycetota bacterium]